MNLTTWHYMGIIILILDIAWIVSYYYYATVKIYNFKKKASKIKQFSILKNIIVFQNNSSYRHEEYQYLGHLWIRKKGKEYYLKIPQEMIDNSITTKYKIISQSMFHKLKKGEKIQISFADKHHTEVRLDAEMNVKNYIATSHQL